MIAKILNGRKKKLPKTLTGPTWVLCVDFSSIGLLVSEKFIKTAFLVGFCGQTADKQTDKQINF